MTINAAFNSGIINTAVNGAVNYADAQNREKVTFDELDKDIQDIVNKIESYDIGGGNNPTPDIPTPTTDPTANWDKTKVDPVESADNVVVPVPKGFVASKATGENTVENGFVIYQGTEDVTDSNKDTAMTTRNQFVWVPVPDPSKMFTTNNGRDVGRLYNFDKTSKTYTEIAWSDTGYREPDVVTGNGSEYDAVASNYSNAGITGITTADQFKTQLETEFAEMKTSVEKYHGFYIGRYETGAVSTAKAVTVKGNSDIVKQTWYKFYQMNKDMIKENGIKSNMIWGSQWDQTMIWFDTQGGAKKNYVYDSTGKGHYPGTGGSTTSTGLSTAYAVNNIYDMAGNAEDWTLEADITSRRVLRGGGYSNSGSFSPASYRSYGYPTYSYGYVGSRSTLIM
ncbi:MAG: hypothetical protein HFJ24_01905 [Clostridia bacterium]|nr:hypothetical protein [Clostridia bacterium]MCI9274804.1 hypothetical protein [Clostridia bacterium]